MKTRYHTRLLEFGLTTAYVYLDGLGFYFEFRFQANRDIARLHIRLLRTRIRLVDGQLLIQRADGGDPPVYTTVRRYPNKPQEIHG